MYCTVRYCSLDGMAAVRHGGAAHVKVQTTTFAICRLSNEMANDRPLKASYSEQITTRALLHRDGTDYLDVSSFNWIDYVPFTAKPNGRKSPPSAIKATRVSLLQYTKCPPESAPENMNLPPRIQRAREQGACLSMWLLHWNPSFPPGQVASG